MDPEIAAWQQALCLARWQAPKNHPVMSAHTRDWLTESGSLSQRLSRHCARFDVTVLREVPYQLDDLSSEEAALLGSQVGIERVVILKGDDTPWIFARSLIPFSLYHHSPLQNLGETPLGLRVFCDPHARRDRLQLAQCQHWWARRSRLWCQDRPLLVSELFLTASPAYAQGSVVC